MKSTLAERDHVERHHSRQHPPPRQSLAQHGNIADAILQTDDDHIGRRVSCNRIGDSRSIGALDGNKHDAGPLEDLGTVGQRQPS